ncbi:MAG TPA: two-component regulator propeller domain-containing protein [Bacteroidales bacterium]|nr:two-component regulator propeller domain-containing protein [Bacteroidales bacterium]
MAVKTGGRNNRLSFLLLCLSGMSSVMPGQNIWQEDEIRLLLTGNVPVISQNWEIDQDPVSRYIYFANSTGLIEYNGISARTFTMPYRQGVRSVYVNDDGMIFTGSYEDFGIWEEGTPGELVYRSLAQDTEVSKNDEIWNIFELNHTVYFQSFTSVYAYNYSTVTTIRCPSNMLFFFRAGENLIAQSLADGLYLFDGSGFTFLEGSEIFGNLKIHAIIEFNFDEYWICTSNNGIFLFDRHTFSPLKNEISEYLKEETCNAGLAVNDTLIAFGTILKGVVFSDKAGRIITSYDYSNGLKNNTVLSLFKDADNRLWIGLDEGANFINVSSPVTHYENVNGNLGTVYTAIRDRDRLYLGTNHGLFAANIRKSNGYYGFTNLRIIPNSQGQVWNLDQFDGRILCGHNEGTFLVEGDALRKISEITGGWSMKRYGDLLLEGTYTGIVSFMKDAKGDWTFKNRINGYTEPTRFIEVDYLGYVWAVHPLKGIYRLELNEKSDSIVNTLYFSSIADTGRAMTMSNINNQVVFLTSDHIFAFDYDKKTFFRLVSLEPGLDEYVSATQIIHYRKNSYWFILDDRIALFNITKELEAEKVLEFFHEYADLPWREQQIVSLDSNTLLIPTRQAFSTYTVDRLIRHEDTSTVIVNRLVFSGNDNTTTLFPLMMEAYRIPSAENNLTAYIANPSGFDMGGREYLYRITEFGESWHRTSTDNFSFLNLRSGQYHLQVKEVFSKKVTEVTFAIRKPFLKSWWAIAMYILTLSVTAVAIVRIWRLTLDRHRQLIEYESGKHRLESELDYKGYELMLTLRYLIRKTDTLRELRDKLDSTKEASVRLPAKFVREMEQIIDHGLDTQTEEWQNVMKNLKLSQEGFFRKLKSKYPTLTPNDLRLCSYLRMNFTTKEIANLTNISSRAVEIGRYRLRSKLNLKHDVNLTEFLIREAESTD